MGLCEPWENLKAQEFPTSDLQHLHPTSPNPSPSGNAGRRGGGNSEEGEELETLRFSRLRPRVQGRLPGLLSLGGPGRARLRGHGEEVLPTSFPFFHEPAATHHPAKMAAATTPRSPPQPHARVPRPSCVSRPQPATRAILRAVAPLPCSSPTPHFSGCPRLHLLGVSDQERTRGAPPLPPRLRRASASAAL